MYTLQLVNRGGEQIYGIGLILHTKTLLTHSFSSVDAIEYDYIRRKYGGMYAVWKKHYRGSMFGLMEFNLRVTITGRVVLRTRNLQVGQF